MNDVTIRRGDAGRARVEAAEIRRRASDFASTAAYSRSRWASRRWTGPLLMQNRRELTIQEPRLALLQSDSLAIAHGLDGHADWIIGEVARLEAAEASVRRWIESNPTSPAVLDLQAAGLPPRHNTRWHCTTWACG